MWCYDKIQVQFTSDECKGIQSGSYILKSTLENGADSIATQVMEGYNIYNHELEMYGTIFPRYRSILADIGYREDLVPRVVIIDYDHRIIFFEDLKARDFQNTLN